MSPIASLAGGLLQALLPASPATNNTTASNLASLGTTSPTQVPDSGQLSSFAQLASTLQQLQQTNPAQYQQVTQQIAVNLQTASQTALAGGNTTQAAQLTQLSTDFSTASTSGQLPNLQDLAKAVAGHDDHLHHAESMAPNSQAISQFLSSMQSNATQNSALNPATIRTR